MMSYDENEPRAEGATTCLAVIYCTLCGNRSVHATDSGHLTMTWRMTSPEVRAMRRALSKTRCVYCDETIDIRVVGGDRRGGRP